jgi:hypothetical protein
MTTGTRNLAAKTKDTLSWNDSDEKSRSTRSTHWDDPPKKAKDEPSFWGRLFGGDGPRPSKTVSGFMSQERPEHASRNH